LSETLEQLTAALAGRYTLERELGRGGMATVYLAQDLKHDRLVALKVLHSRFATAVGPQRFLREIRTTAQLSHPHILAVFDSGRTERSAGGPANAGVGEFLWYAMPYVEGESLREKLIRERQLALKDALRITREVASALDYAHGHGIVHRDIKPENIMLTRQGEALVADFGIAKALATAATGISTLTEAGLALGTAHYMSPEQVDGTPEVDGRADVYALGCVLYEMLAGEPPYTGASALAVIAKRLVDPVPSIRRLREAIPPNIDTAIQSALATVPADRYPTAGGFADALDRGEVAAGDGTAALPAVRPRTSRRFWGLAALAAGVAVAVGLSSRLTSPGRPNVERVAVYPFANRTGDASLDALGSLSADWIAQAVSRVPGVELVTMPSLMVDPSIAEAVRTSRDSLGKAAGAHRVIWGSIYRTGDSVRLVANLTDVTRGILLASIEATAAVKTPESAVQLLAERVSTGVLARQSRDTVEMLMRSTRPPTFAAFQAFAEGMTVWETEGQGKAAALFERAVALDSTFLSPLVWAGFIYRNEGEYAHADSIGSIAERQRERLGPFERAALERMLAEVRGDNEGALAASRQVLSAAPTSDWAKCVTAEAALWVNRPRYALRILDGLETRPGIYNGGAWCDLVPFQAWLMLNDGSRALATARRFGRKWTQGELGTGTELYLEATALARLGRTAEARALADSAATLNPELCFCLFIVGHELRNAGDPSAARAVFERAATMVRGSRDTADLARAGEALYWAGRWDEASAIFRQLTGHAKYAVRAHGALGVLAARRENPVEARAADAWLASVDPRHRRGEVSVWRARIAAALNERDQAVALLKQAFAEGQTQDYFGMYGPGMAWFRQDPHFDSLRDFPAYVALLRPKG
jgi:tetratricopeptide (TPR) repeat protein/TolB-like protein